MGGQGQDERARDERWRNGGIENLFKIQGQQLLTHGERRNQTAFTHKVVPIYT